MTNVTALLLALCIFLYGHSLSSRVEARRLDELRLKTDDTGEQKKELLDVLHDVLEKLQNRRMAIWERTHSRLPRCNVGDFCSVKKGARFGQLCDCPRGSKCNYFFLKCLTPPALWAP